MFRFLVLGEKWYAHESYEYEYDTSLRRYALFADVSSNDNAAASVSRDTLVGLILTRIKVHVNTS